MGECTSKVSAVNEQSVSSFLDAFWMLYLTLQPEKKEKPACFVTIRGRDGILSFLFQERGSLLIKRDLRMNMA